MHFDVPKDLALFPINAHDVAGLAILGGSGHEDTILENNWRRPALTGDRGLPTDVLRLGPADRKVGLG